ncbi:MAG: hypothetical protein GY787_30580 [Alteromonadales bacterium]|nr:hypothetical protein [Alteromonadales bacterium]MCP4990104.1 hypothetical protein [Colwellia sp.]
MNYNFLLVTLGLLLVSPVNAQDPVVTAFNQLNHSIANYGEKLGKCRIIRKENKIMDSDIEKLKSMPAHVLKALSWLNQSATNKCTQPERGMLAELVLNIESLNLDKSKPNEEKLFNAMDAIRSLEFDISRLNPSEYFFNLTSKEQALLLEITSLKKPFDVVDVFLRAEH